MAVPLLATQILWINLLTDAAPALALGVDPPLDDVMARSPRRLSDRVIDTDMQLGIGFVGLVMAVVTLVALDLHLPGGLIGGSGNITEARTMAFTTLVLAQLYNCFNARSDRVSAFHQTVRQPAALGAPSPCRSHCRSPSCTFRCSTTRSTRRRSPSVSGRAVRRWPAPSCGPTSSASWRVGVDDPA